MLTRHRFLMMSELIIHPNMKQQGFTLVELLIFMAIYSVLIVILTGIFVSIIDVKLRSEATSDVQTDANYILARLDYDFSQASAISLPAILGTPANTLRLTVNGNNYTYTLNQGNLELQTNIDTNSLNSYNTTVSDFNVLRLGNTGGKNAVKISFTLTSTIADNNQFEVKNFSSTLGIR